MTDMVIVVPRIDPAADRRDARVFTGATIVLWVCLFVALGTFASNWLPMLWLIVPVGALAVHYSVLTVRSWVHVSRDEPDLVARLEDDQVALGAPGIFRRGKEESFVRALPVNVGVTRRKQGLRSSTRWLISSEGASATFTTNGLAAIEAEGVVTRGLASVGLAVETVYSDRSAATDG